MYTMPEFIYGYASIRTGHKKEELIANFENTKICNDYKNIAWTFKDMFFAENALFSNTVIMPVRTIVLSCLFFIILLGYSIIGYILKNKCLIGISLGYSVLLFMGIVLFVLFVLEVFNVELLNTIAMWYSVASMAPMLGFVWFFGIFAIILFVIHFHTATSLLSVNEQQIVNADDQTVAGIHRTRTVNTETNKGGRIVVTGVVVKGRQRDHNAIPAVRQALQLVAGELYLAPIVIFRG